MKKLILLLAFPAIFFQANGQDEKKEETPCPCCAEEYRQFDFWLGDWETYIQDDVLAGTNNIVLMYDGCILQENWVSAAGPFEGTSYNYYDNDKKLWRQTWVDNFGGSLLLSGGLDENGSMVLASETDPQPEGGSNYNRITWTPNKDGSVRQHWELSNDYGKNWTTLFDGLYKRKAAKK